MTATEVCDTFRFFDFLLMFLLVIVIWDAEIVEPFSNADPKYATPPAQLDEKKWFDKDPLKASEFAITYPSSDGARMRAMQKVIVTPLKDVYAPGMYSSKRSIVSCLIKANDPVEICIPTALMSTAIPILSP